MEAGCRSPTPWDYRAGASRLTGVERPAADPAKLLAQWMEWESGDVTPGRVMANLKTGGLRDLLEQLVAERVAEPADG
jgi:hypothetical protein